MLISLAFWTRRLAPRAAILALWALAALWSAGAPAMEDRARAQPRNLPVESFFARGPADADETTSATAPAAPDSQTKSISIGVGAPAATIAPAAPEATLAPAAETGGAQPGRLFVILVGVDDYQSPLIPDLRGCVRDTLQMRDALQRLFGVPDSDFLLLHNAQATREGIRRAMNSLASERRVTPYDRVLFLFSGHGVSIAALDGTEVGFLIPYDAEISLESRDYEKMLSTCLPLDEMRRLARFIPARHTFFLVDACYGGLAATRQEPRNVPSAELALSLRSIQILTAGSRDQEVLESERWGGSAMRYLLTELFADHSRPEWFDGVLTAGEMGAYVKSSLPDLVRAVRPEHKQTPQFERMEGLGEFFLALPGKNPALLPPEAAAARTGEGITEPAGLVLRVACEVPPRAELSPTDVETLLSRALMEKEFRVYDEAALAKAMRAGDEAPTRFEVRGQARYWLEETTLDPFKTGRYAFRARFQAKLEIVDLYSGRVAVRAPEIDTNKLIYLREDIRAMIQEQFEPLARRVAEDLKNYIQPPTKREPQTEPVMPLLFLEGKLTPEQERLAEEAVAPGIFRAVSRAPEGARFTSEEVKADQFRRLGLAAGATLPVEKRAAMLKGAGARYAITAKFRALGKREIIDLFLSDCAQKDLHIAQKRLQFAPEDGSPEALAAEVERAILQDFLPILPRK